MSKLPHQEFNLSDGEVRTIGLITLYWGTAEFVVGEAIAAATNVDRDVARMLIHPLNFAQKIRHMGDLRAAGKLPNGADVYVEELKFAQGNFKSGRNIFSHSMLFAGHDGSRRMTTARGQEADPDDLPLLLEQSKYAALVAGRLMSVLIGGGPFSPLPERPIV